VQASHVSLELPWPPSSNRYYRNVGHRTLISKDGRAYKEQVALLAIEQLGIPLRALEGNVTLRVELFPPDRRRRDIDNHAGKALLDSLQHAGVLQDDSQVVELHAVMRPPERRGRCLVEIVQQP